MFDGLCDLPMMAKSASRQGITADGANLAPGHNTHNGQALALADATESEDGPECCDPITGAIKTSAGDFGDVCDKGASVAGR